MKKNISLILFIIVILSSCTTNNILINSNSYSNEIFSNNETVHIQFNSIFKLEDEFYGIYLYSLYCPACNDLTEPFFSFLSKEDKCIENVYAINIDTVNQNDLNYFLKDNSLDDNEIVFKSLNATCINQIYFTKVPCLFLIEKINNENTLIDYYVNYNDLYDLFSNNILK